MERVTSKQQAAIEKLAKMQDESALWDTIVSFQGHPFLTATGLPFTYTIKRGKDGSYNKELLIDRRGNGKTLTWISIRLAYERALEMKGQIIVMPKALGDIRGVSYIYLLLWSFGVIEASAKYAEKMSGGEKYDPDFNKQVC